MFHVMAFLHHLLSSSVEGSKFFGDTLALANTLCAIPIGLFKSNFYNHLTYKDSLILLFCQTLQIQDILVYYLASAKNMVWDWDILLNSEAK